MALDFTQPIPITTVNSADYPRPKLNADGQWVVSANAVNAAPNKIMLYDPLSLNVYPVTPYTVSMDYYFKVKSYENTLSKIQQQNDLAMKGFVDTTNPNQVNSVGDLITVGNDDWQLFGGMNDAIPKLIKGDFKGAWDARYNYSYLKLIKTKLEATGELLYTGLVAPVEAEIEAQKLDTEDKRTVGESLKDIGLKYLSNSLVNLGETMDAITGANIVKGFVQGLPDGLDQALSNVKAGQGDAYGTGRKQFDWNIKSGSAAIDVVANTILEVVSDPTTWISFGTSAAIKTIGKDALGGVIQKSAQDVGIRLAKEQVDDLALAALRTFTYKDDSLVNILRNIKIDDILETAITPELSNKFVSSLIENADTLAEMKTLNTIKSVRATSDAAEHAAMKAVGLSSGLGWGYGALKGIFKGTKAGINNLPVLTATLNRIFKNNPVVADMTLQNMNEIAVKLEKEMKAMKDLLGLSDEYTNEILRRATKTFQETKYYEVQAILNEGLSSSKMYQSLNEWANKEGYDNIEILMERLRTRADIIPEDLVNMVQEIEFTINKAIRKTNAGVIREFSKALNPTKVVQPNIVEIRKLLEDYHQLYNIADVTNNVPTTVLDKVRHALIQGAVYIEGEAANWNLDMFDKFHATQYPVLFEYLPVAELDQMEEVMQYAVSVLKDKNSSDFLRQNAKRMIRTLNTDKFYHELYETGMTIDKAENIISTLEEIAKNNAAEIRAGLVKVEDLNYIKKTLDDWLIDPITMNTTIAQQANDAWSRIYKFYYRENRISADQLARVYQAFRKEMPSFKSLSYYLSRIANLVEAMPVQYTPIQMTTSQMVSKAVNNIPDALITALKSKGLDEGLLSKLILQFSGVDLTQPLHYGGGKKVGEPRIALQKLNEQLKDMDDLTYYIKEGGLSELAQEWENTGFTIELGNKLLGHLDDMLVRLTYTNGLELDSRRVAVQPEIVQDIQLVRDEVQSLIDMAYQNTETRIKTTTELVSSKLYQVKLSHIAATVQLLTTELVEPVFESIRTNRGLGEFLDALVDADIPNFATKAVQNLQSLSKSIYVARKLFNLIDKAGFEPHWKDGIFDTLAGMVKENRSSIPDAEDFANELLTKAKVFLDNKNNQHLLHLNDLSTTKDPLEEAEMLFKIASDKSFERTEYWQPLFDGLNKASEEDTFNVFYSAGQTAKKGGQLYSFAHALPDGSSALYINRPVYESMVRNLDDKTAQELFGTSSKEAKLFLQMNMESYADKANVIIYDTTEEFIQSMYRFAQALKDVTKDTTMIPRLVGYNNALDSLGTDKVLSDFMYKNRLNTKIIYNSTSYKSLLAVETLDASQYIRAAKDGSAVITDAMQDTTARIVREVKEYLDRANAGEPFAKATLMPDFSRDVTASLREMLAVIDNFMEVKYMTEDHPALLRSLTESQYNVIRMSFSNTQLMAFRQTITDVLKNIGDTLLSIKESNQLLGQTLLIQDAIKEYLDEPNIMQILTKYLVGDQGVPAYSFKLFNDPKVFNTWFDKIPEDMTTLGRMYDVADALQKQMGRIKHHHLLMDIDPEAIVAVSQRLKAEYLGMAGRKYSTWTAAVLNLKPSTTNQMHNYLVAKQYYDCIQHIAKPDQLKDLRILLEEQFNYNPILDYIFDAEHTLMLNKPLYTPGVKVLQSTLVDESNALLQKIGEIHDIINDVKKMETLNDALVVDQSLREKYGYSLASMRTKEQLTMTYGSFIDSVKAQLDEALEVYTNNVEKMKTPEARHYARYAYTEKVNNVLKQLNDLKPNHARRRVRNILSMNAADYTKFLYKYAQGIQIIDLGADIFKQADTDIQGILLNFMQTLKQAEQFGVRTALNKDTQYLHVYLDKASVDLAELEKTVDDFVVPNISGLDAPPGDIAQSYLKLAHQLDAHTQGMYSLSMHRTMNKERYQELLDYLPDRIKKDMLDLEYLDNRDLLETYSQTILGDYESGLGKIFTTYSGNIVTNVAAGFNAVYHNLRGKDLYQTLFFNKEYSLKAWIDLVSRYGTVKHADVLDAINKRAMVVCTYSPEHGVVKVPINTAKQYQAALDSGAILLDYHSYARSIEVLNKNKINSKLLNALNKNYLVPLKVGQLLSTGWILRNIPDSTIKGWTQAGFDPMYMVSMFNRTKQVMADYQYTYRKLFDFSQGSLSPDRIAKFFDTYNGPDQRILNQTIFKRLLAFYDSTSSVATPAQLDLYKGTAHKLFLKVEGAEGITEDIVADAVQIFAENPTYAATKAVLFERYPENVAKELLLLKKFAPTKQLEDTWISKVIDNVYPVKKFMELNSSFEMLIRTHTFLYHSTYTNGTIAQARKMVDMSQFNRAYDTKGTKLMETLLPFSSFQLDNFLFWTDTAKTGKYNVLNVVDDVIQGSYNEEELDLEELSRNMSLQYLFLSGNLVLNYNDGLVLKTNDSLHGVMQLLTAPVNTVAGMLNVPMETMITLLSAINADPDAYAEDSFNNPKPISEYSPEDYTKELLQLIPVVGAAYIRWQSGQTKGRLEFSDLLLPMVLPSVFGVAKLDSAGTTYESRPIGTDWYSRDEEYKKTHRYVFGISYVPSWMTKDPRTYADTYGRLLGMGYSEQIAAYMVQNGWYMKAPNYQLKHYSPYVAGGKYQKRFYARRVYPRTPRVIRSYPKYNVLPKKQKKFVRLKTSNRYESMSPDRTRVVRGYKVRRIYRPQLYSNRYTRTGVSRELMINWRGANRSSRQLLRDRSRASRSRVRMQLRQIKPS